MKEKKLLIAAITALVGAAGYLIIRRLRAEDFSWPKSAPQLDIDNPGSQDDFPKPPAESGLG